MIKSPSRRKDIPKVLMHCVPILKKVSPDYIALCVHLLRSLNMPHDDDQRCGAFNGQSTRHNVMSRMLDSNTYPWSWSNCSRHFLTEFLE